MKNMPQTLAKIVLIPLRLTAAASAADVGIYVKIKEFERPSHLALRATKLMVSNEEMKYIIKIVSKRCYSNN